MTRYEQIKTMHRQVQQMAVDACAKEAHLVGAGPVTSNYGDNLQDAADALELAMLAMTPVPACGVDIDSPLSLDRGLNRLVRFEHIGDEDVLVYASQAQEACLTSSVEGR